MKHLIMTILFLTTNFFSYSQSEYCFENPITISTHWDSYNNTDEYPNDFNWTEEFFEMYLRYSPNSPEFVKSPYYVQSNTLYSDNVWHLRQTTDPTKKDFLPEDGWELLYKEFGECCTESQRVDYPFFILYNRYRGTMRVFLMVKELEEDAFDAAMVKVRWKNGSNRKTALFQHVRRTSAPIHKFDQFKEFSTPNKYLNKDYFWLYADLGMAYDPCTCDQPDDVQLGDSKLELQFSVINSVAVDLEGDITGNIFYESVLSGVGPQNVPSMHTNQFDIGPYSVDQNELIETFQAGQRAYKEFEGFSSQFDDFLDTQDKNYKDELIRTWYVENNGAAAAQNVMDAAFKTYIQTDEGMKDVAGLTLKDKNLGPLRTISAAIPYAGIAWGIFDYLNSGGRDASSAETPTPNMPLAMNAQLQISGSLTDQAMLDAPLIFTPGTKTTQGPSVPLYNNILGVTNLLNDFQLQYNRYETRIEDPFGTVKIDPTLEVRQYRLQEELDIIFNPSANLRLETIEAAYVLEYDERFLDSFESFGQQHQKKDYRTNHPLIIGDYLSETPQNMITMLKRSGFFLDFMHKDYGDPDTKIRFRTDYAPLGCFKDQSFPLIFHNPAQGQTAPSIAQPRIYVRVVSTFQPESEPLNTIKDPITIIHTYEMSDDIEDAEPGYQEDEYFIDAYTSWNLNNFDPTTQNIDMYFTGIKEMAHPNGYLALNVSGPTHQLALSGLIQHDEYATGITVSQNATVQNAILTASRNITVLNSEILPDSELRLSLFGNEYCDPLYIPNVSQEQIVSKCNSEGYRNRAASKTRHNYFAESNLRTENEKKILLYPNPARSSFNINSTIDISYIEIFDSKGSVIVSSTVNLIDNIDISHLGPGVYMVRMYNNAKEFISNKPLNVL